MCKENKFEVKLELKGKVNPDRSPGSGDSTVEAFELVKEMGMFDLVGFSSFVHERLVKIREMNSSVHADGMHVVRTGALFSGIPPSDYLAQCKSKGVSEIHLRYDAMTKERVDEIRESGMKSMVWLRGPKTMKEDAEKWIDVGNEDEDMYKVLAMTGVDEICCNRPDVMIKAIGGLQSIATY